MDRGHSAGRTFVIVLLLAALTAVIYLPTAGFDFVNYDDPVYVSGNGWVQKGLTAESVRWAFTNTRSSNWFPLTWLSHMTDVELFGMKAGAHHLVSAGIHLVNALLLFLLLQAMTSSPWKSAVVAALFAVHPLHVESVAWIGERKDVLGTLFGLLTVAAWLRCVKRPGAIPYGAALLLYAASLMSKAMLVTLPVVLLLLDYWPLGRWNNGPLPAASDSGASRTGAGRLLFEKVPLFALAALSSLITYMVQRGGGSMREVDLFPPAVRLGNAALSSVKYIALTLWPRSLAVFYPHPGAPPAGALILSVLLLVLVTALAIRWRRSHPYVAVGWFWYLVTLLPVIGIVQVGWQAMADRYTYIPLTGLFLALVWGVEAVAGSRGGRFLACGAAVIILAFTVSARHQAGFWRSSITLFERALEVTDENFVAHHNLAEALLAEGRDEEARSHLEEVIRLRPEYERAYVSLGMVLSRLGLHDEAEGRFRQALRIYPSFAEAYFNLGTLALRMGRREEAIGYFGEAVRIRPWYAKAHNNLGGLLLEEGRKEEALEHFRSAAGSEPGYVEAHANLALLLEEEGLLEESSEHYRLALESGGDSAYLRMRLAGLLAGMGDHEEAEHHYREALKLDPRLGGSPGPKAP